MMNNIHHALYYVQPQEKMLPTLWRLFGDKRFKVHFELQQQWRIDKRKLHTVPEDEQDSPRLCTTNNHRRRCCLLCDDFLGKKCSFWTTTTMTYWQKEVTHSTRGWTRSTTPCTIYNHRGRWDEMYNVQVCFEPHNNAIMTKGRL